MTAVADGLMKSHDSHTSCDIVIDFIIMVLVFMPHIVPNKNMNLGWKHVILLPISHGSIFHGFSTICDIKMYLPLLELYSLG